MVSLSTALLSPLALAGVASAADTRRCTPEHPKVILGGIPRIPFGTNTSTECATACLGISDCAGYQYFSRNGACLVYPSVNTEEYVADDAASVLVSGRCFKYQESRLLLTPPRNADFPGFDIGTAFAFDPAECSQTCRDTPTCFAYSWTSYNGGSCYMKSGKPATVTGPYDGSVVSGQVFTCQAPRYDADMTGTDLTSVPRAEWQDCCDVCRTTGGCKGFSWSNYNGGTCWLKSAVTGFSSTSGVISAVL